MVEWSSPPPSAQACRGGRGRLVVQPTCHPPYHTKVTDHPPPPNVAAQSKPGNRKRSAADSGVGDPSTLGAPKRGKTPIVLTLHEKFSPAAVEFIVNEMRLEDLPEGMFEAGSDFAKLHNTMDKAELLKILKQNFARWAKAEGKVSYRYGKNWAALKMGRIYADNGLQGFPRPIRATLSAEFYDDVDIKNAQPTLIKQKAAQKGWAHAAVEKWTIGVRLPRSTCTIDRAL